jgi:hypothetical protein
MSVLARFLLALIITTGHQVQIGDYGNGTPLHIEAVSCDMNQGEAIYYPWLDQWWCEA